MRFDRLDGAAAEAGEQAEGQVGRAQELVEQELQHARQALPAMLRVAGEAAPAGLGEGPVGFGHALRGRDAAVHEPAALLVRRAVQRFEHLARELAGFLEHADRELGVHLFVAGKLGHAAIEIEDLPEQEGDVVNGGGVCGHGSILWCQL